MLIGEKAQAGKRESATGLSRFLGRARHLCIIATVSVLCTNRRFHWLHLHFTGDFLCMWRCLLNQFIMAYVLSLCLSMGMELQGALFTGRLDHAGRRRKPPKSWVSMQRERVFEGNP